MESLRTQATINPKKLLSVVSPKAGDPLTWEEVTADTVNSSMEIYTRSRAFFQTISWLTIATPEFFGLQDCLFVDLRIFQLLQLTVANARPPVSHFVTAWAFTMQLWSDEVRTNSKTLAALVRETGSWTQFWTSWSPSTAASSSTAIVHQERAALPAQTQLESEVSRLRRLTSQLQSERDRSFAGDKRKAEDQHWDSRPNKGGKGKGGKGKGKGKGNRGNWK